MIPHLLRCRGLAVVDYGFALGRLGSGASSTFAQLEFRTVCFSCSFFLIFFGRVLPVVPLHIFPRLVRISPFPIQLTS
jgi:hypothetical protein